MSVFLRDMCINKFDGHKIVAYPETTFDLGTQQMVSGHFYRCSRCWTLAEEIGAQGPKRTRSPNKPKPGVPEQQSLAVEE